MKKIYTNELKNFGSGSIDMFHLWCWFAVSLCGCCVVKVTTHSRLLLSSDVLKIARLMHLKRDDIKLQSLQAFDTEQQFCKMLK